MELSKPLKSARSSQEAQADAFLIPEMLLLSNSWLKPKVSTIAQVFAQLAFTT
jgi:hypothetical protein